MGRTVPSFRIAEMQEVGKWRGFRRSLPRRERADFDAMLDTARLYISASSFAVRTSRLEGMGMALLFHHYKQLLEVAERIESEEPAIAMSLRKSSSRIIKEIDSWRPFGEALREEDRELFRKMMQQVCEYLPSMEVSSEPFPNDSLFMGLVFLQHRMIQQLGRELEKEKAAPREHK